MKKLLIGLTLVAASVFACSNEALAHGYYHYRGPVHHGGYFVAGVVVGTIIVHPRPVYVAPAPAVVYVERPVVIVSGYYMTSTGVAVSCGVREEFYRNYHTPAETQQCESYWHSIGQ